jgi:hypothetical protein
MITIDARTLAWLAEKADGIRDKELVLYVEGDRVRLEPATAANQGAALLQVRTRNTVKNREQPPTISIAPEWDAIFLSEAAVEKFLFPYYKAQRLLTEEDEEKLRAAYYQDNVYGIVHLYPSRPLLILNDGKVQEVPVDMGQVGKLL